MSRVNKSVPSRKRRKKVLALAKGFAGRRKNCFRIAKQAVEKSLQYAYRDRKKRKSQMRSLWIQRINAATREHDLTYSTFMCLLKKRNIVMNRKSLADIAVHHPDAFSDLIKRITS